jgi:D-arabinose 1-dehydrogenase-like Zn-dependent alcohol dehydrogenase
MSHETIQGYAAREVGQSLEPFTYEPPALGEHDLRASISHCGLCRSDVHAIDDYYGITDIPSCPATRSWATYRNLAAKHPP